MLPPDHPRLKAIYITAPAPFPEVESFVDDSVIQYNLELVRLPGSMKQALSDYLEGDGKGVKGVLVGTRRNDPHGGV
jgi:FAD synthetase